MVPQRCRIPRMTCKMTSGFAEFVEKKEAAAEHEYIAKVHEWLKERPDKAKAVWMACDNGLFDEKKDDKRNFIPPSRTHLNILSHKVLKDALCCMCPSLDGPLLMKVDKQPGHELLNMFTFATGAKAEDPVFSHDIRIFNKYYSDLHAALGNRLAALTIDSDGTVQWRTTGQFTIKKTENGNFIQHISGAQVLASV
eukprot:9808075-Lingulodinium_polyedra.AAC.1